MSIEEKEILNALIREIEEAAEEEVKKILNEAKEQAKKILEEAEKRALEEKKRREDEARRRFRIDVLKKIAYKRLEYRRKYLVEKYKMIMELVEDIRRSITREAETRSDNYYGGLKNLLKEAIENIEKNDLIIVFNKRDEENIRILLEDLLKFFKEKGRNLNVTLSPDLPEGEYGVVVRSSDEKEYFVNTLSTRFKYFIDERLPLLLYIKSR